MPSPSSTARTPASPAHSCSAANAAGSQAVPMTTSRTVAVGGRSRRLRQRRRPAGHAGAVTRPVVGLLGLGEHPQQGRLAAAVAPDDADPVAVGDAERDVVEQDPRRAVGLADVLEVDEVGHHGDSVATAAPGPDRRRAHRAAAAPAARSARPRASTACSASLGQEDAGRPGAGDEPGERAALAARRRASRAAPGAAAAPPPAGRWPARAPSTSGSRWRSAAISPSGRGSGRRAAPRSRSNSA